MSKRTKNRAQTPIVTLFLLAICIFALLPGFQQRAYADELSDAKAALENASGQLNNITNEYNQIQARINELDTQMAETSNNVMEAQQAMLEGQDVLGEAVKDSYKAEGASSLISIFLMSENLEEFLKNITYYSSIQEDQAQLIAEQKELRNKFQETLNKLETEKDEQDSLQDQATAKKAEAEKVVSEASAKVSSIESERARLAELQKRAEELAQQKEEKEDKSTPVPDWNTRPSTSDGDSNDSNSNESVDEKDTPSNDGKNSENPGDNNANDSNPPKKWNTGVASAYGGSSDPHTPNPGRTATGAICNDTSMGVAIPMSWSNYRKYFGHLVEIKYGGRTVMATINDCGYMGAGSRSLDLQPGVFKALGFKTCQAWGIKTVQYRIL